MGMSKVMLIGRAACAAELRWIHEHEAVAEFPLVLEHVYRASDGAERKARIEIAVVAYGRMAERCAGVPARGEDVFVEGRLKLETLKGEDGKPSSRYCVVADRCEYAGAAPLGPPGGARQQRELVAAGA